MPPLTLPDKVIYWAAATAMLLVLAGLIYAWVSWRQRVEFGDPQVVCSAGHLSVMWAIPAFLSLFFTGLGLWCWGYCGRRPIFGIPGFLYGLPYPRIYPLFMKNRPERKPREKRFVQMTAAVIAGVNLVCLSLSLLSIQGRDTLYEDGIVREVNMFGGVSGEYTVRDTEQILLSVCSYTNGSGWRRTKHWSVRLELVMTDGSSYDFSPGFFRRGETDGTVRGWVRDLERIMVLYPPQSICPENGKDLDRVIADCDLNEKEVEVLRQLFRAE